MPGDDTGGPAPLRLGVGSAERLEGGGIRWVNSDGSVAAAGDGVAAAVWDAIRDRSNGGGAALPATAAPVAGTPGAGRERAIAVDQTNWSVVVDDAVVVKAVLHAGAADRAARLLPLLAGTGIAPELRGVLRWPDGGVAALASEYVPGAEDGWTWGIEDVLAWREGPRTPDPEWPGAVGALVARLHDALARGEDTVVVRRDALRRRAEELLEAALLSCAGTATAQRLTLRRGLLVAELDALPAESVLPAFGLHGDLHVGQLLRSPQGHPGDPAAYRVLDFDGDPQAPAEERDAPAPAVVDLGHLLVSVDLVAAAVQRRLGGADPAVVEWAGRARRNLLSAYTAELDRRGRAALLGEPDHLPALLAAAEVEQLARELTYAARFLPRWRYAPDGAIAARHPLPDRKDDIPWTPPDSPTTSD